jgi:hypothetical protein
MCVVQDASQKEPPRSRPTPRTNRGEFMGR